MVKSFLRRCEFVGYKGTGEFGTGGSGISLTAKWPFVYVKTAWFHREEREVGVFCFDTIQHLYINILIIHRETTAFDTLPGVHLCQSRGSWSPHPACCERTKGNEEQVQLYSHRWSWWNWDEPLVLLHLPWLQERRKNQLWVWKVGALKYWLRAHVSYKRLCF